MLDLGELLNIPYVDMEMGFHLSPDGKRIAFSWNPSGSWEIYETDLSGEGGIRMLSSGPGGKFHPRYSPDGSMLAYALDRDGSENYHIILKELTSGEEHDLTPGVTSALQANFAWAPDGRRIAFISDQSGRFDTYQLSVQEALKGIFQPRQIFDAGYPAWKVSWSADGAYLAIIVEASGIDYGTLIVPDQGGEAVRITDQGRLIDAGQASWSPDGKTLAFSSDDHGYNDIGLYEVASGQIRWLTDGEGEKQYPCWSQDGRTLAYIYNRGTVSWLAVQAADDTPVLYQIEAGVHYAPSFSPDGRSIFFGFDNPRHPTDLWRLLLDDGKFIQITHSLPVNIAHDQFIMPREITYPGIDGKPVPALLFQPENTVPGPAVLVIHGGPDWFFEMTWYPLMACLASRGWVVLAPNYRGSTGYGRQWQEASRYDFGRVDADDVAAGAYYLAQEGLADPARIAITGRSHGGYLTACCLTRYPDLWAAGSALVPFLNWFTNHEEIRPDLKQWDLENFGDPVKDHDLWRERSPSFYLDQVQAPLQLICGRHDARCPVSDSIQAYEELKQMGKEVELIMYEDEGHTFLKRENVLDSENRRISFLTRYLEPSIHFPEKPV